MNHDNTRTEDGDWGAKGYWTLGELAGRFVVGLMAIGILLTIANNLGRWIGSVINDVRFGWGLPAPSTFAWYSVAMVTLFSAIAGANAQRLWVADGGWSPRVLANILLCGVGLIMATTVAVALIAG